MYSFSCVLIFRTTNVTSLMYKCKAVKYTEHALSQSTNTLKNPLFSRKTLTVALRMRYDMNGVANENSCSAVASDNRNCYFHLSQSFLKEFQVKKKTFNFFGLLMRRLCFRKMHCMLFLHA